MLIIIPFKEQSVRCQNKNFILFPYVYRWLRFSKLKFYDICIVTTSENVIAFAREYGIKTILKTEDLDKASDIYDAYYAAKKLNASEYIHLPITQPIRSYTLAYDALDKLHKSNCDFVTSYQIVSDRSIFLIDDKNKFVKQSKNRKGALCKDIKMLDGAIYAVKTEFIDKICDDEDLNESFWNGKFETIENEVEFFIDVDKPKDLKKIEMLKGVYEYLS